MFNCRFFFFLHCWWRRATSRNIIATIISTNNPATTPATAPATASEVFKDVLDSARTSKVVKHLQTYSLFLSNVNECVSARESKEFVEGVNSKTKLQLYKILGKKVDINPYRTDGKKLMAIFRTIFWTETAIIRHKHTYNTPRLARNYLQPSAAHLRR